MPRPARREPTDGELKILTLLWDQGPAELGLLRDRLQARRQVATTTVATMLKIMLDKGFVRRSQGERGYVWSPRVTRRVTQRNLLRKLLASAFEGSARGLVAHMVADGKLDPDDRAAILRLLEGDAEGRDDGPDDGPDGDSDGPAEMSDD